MAHTSSEHATGHVVDEVIRSDRGAATQQITVPLWLLARGDVRSRTLERYGAVTARILMSQIFLLSGVAKIFDWSGTETIMASRGMIWVPFFLFGAIVCELAGGLSVFLGWKARLGALLLFLYLVPVTLVFHNFWTYPAAEQQVQMIMFLKNLTIMGGLWMVITFGPGFCSIDNMKLARAESH